MRMSAVFGAALLASSVCLAEEPAGVDDPSEATEAVTVAAPVSWLAPLPLLPIRVEGRAIGLIGQSRNATEGYVGQQQLSRRPLLRVGELLETIPGFIATQHSGAGKGNQMFLRGFNLDHGTDFATSVAGIPINLPSHAHGQGYTDLNFLIPELIGHLEFRKGPYAVEDGDFGAAGAADFRLFDRLDRPLIDLSLGSDDYRRAVYAGSTGLADGDLLAGVEVYHHDGPWTQPDDFDRFNAVLRYTRDSDVGRFSLTAMGYDGRWSATDQIPRRAVEAGTLGRFDAVDPSDGGESHRYSLSGEWSSGNAADGLRASIYAVDYRMDLYSNFTYFLDDPVNGDQFRQFDDRNYYGGRLERHVLAAPFGLDSKLVFGLQARFDDIHTTGLFRSRERVTRSTISRDAVQQWSSAGYLEWQTRWTSWMRSVAGARFDYHHFDVDSNDPRNSGRRDDALLSPRLNLIFGPFDRTEFYFSAGRGYHSNDARGTVRRFDPNDGSPTDPVDPLVAAEGLELGLRSEALPGLQTSFTLFLLDLDSELVFVGDAGTTEPNRSTRRYGFEWANFWRPRPWLTLDLDLAVTHARFRRNLGEGRRIPNSLEHVVTSGITFDRIPGLGERWSGAARVRHFGGYPLTEGNEVRAGSTTLVHLDLRYAIRESIALRLGVFNLLDRKDSDIEYFESSRLPGEPAEGIEDVLFHPVMPRQFRVGLHWRL